MIWTFFLVGVIAFSLASMQKSYFHAIAVILLLYLSGYIIMQPVGLVSHLVSVIMYIIGMLVVCGLLEITAWWVQRSSVYD